jgi:site-specific DNA recombinase
MTTATLTRPQPTQLGPGGAFTPVGETVAYNRISRFRVARGAVDTLVSRGVDRQGADAEACAEMLQLGPVRHFTDNNRLASKYRSREREQFAALLAHIRSGAVAYVLVWVVDRVIRDTDDLSDLLAACRQGGALLVQTASGTTCNPNDPEDVLRLKISGAVAEYEVAKMSMRVLRAQAERVKVGATHGGPRRFGYEPGMTDIRESEAHWVRWMAAGVLAGRSLKSLTAELNANQVKTATGIAWRASNLGQFLRRPMLAGLRTHKGEIVGQAAWPAILELSTWEAVRVLLEDPARRTSQTQARRYLLSSLAVCGVCGSVLRGRNNGYRDAVRPSYICEENRCISRRADLVEERVRLEVVERLSKIDAAAVLAEPDDSPSEADQLRARIDTLKANLRALADEAVLGLITRDQLHSATATVNAEIAKLEAQTATLALAETQPLAVLQGLAGRPDAAALFDALDLDRRRAIVDALCTVTVHRAARKGARFDPALVQVDWKR